MGLEDQFSTVPISEAGAAEENAQISPAPESDLSAAYDWVLKLCAPRVAIPFLLLLSGVLFFVNLGSYPLYTKGEPREAVTVIDMLYKKGGISALILPMRAGLEIPSKPLLMHWLAALISLLAGRINEWTVRLPSAILATLGVTSCYLYIRRLFDPLAAFLSAIVLATNFQYLQAATGARVDMTLCFFSGIAFFEFLLIAEGLTQRRTLLYVAIALAVLAKGPVGLVLPAATAVLWIGLQRRWDLLGKLELPKGALIVAVVAGGWYLAAILIGRGAFVQKQILIENVFTYLDKPGVSRGHEHPFYYLELALLAGFLPWSLLLPFVGERIASFTQLRNPRVLYLLLWCLLVLVFYSPAFSKRGIYLLSLYPALAALTGTFLAQLMAGQARPRWVPALSYAGAAVFLICALSGLLSVVVLSIWPALAARPLVWLGITTPGFVLSLHSLVNSRLIAAVVLCLAQAGAGYLLWRGPGNVSCLVFATAAAMVCFALAANVYVVPATAMTVTLKDFSLEVKRQVDDHSVAYLGWLSYDVAFYTAKSIPITSDPARDNPQYLIAGDDLYQKMKSGALRDYIVVAKSGPADLDGTGAMVLLRQVTSDDKPPVAKST